VGDNSLFGGATESNVFHRNLHRIMVLKKQAGKKWPGIHEIPCIFPRLAGNLVPRNGSLEAASTAIKKAVRTVQSWATRHYGGARFTGYLLMRGSEWVAALGFLILAVSCLKWL
jgi:hypothetical protein